MWEVGKRAAYGFIEDEALRRGAAIAFYTATSIAPLLLIVIAIAGLAIGHDAAQGAIASQFSSLMGQQTAAFLEQAVANASNPTSRWIAAAIGAVTLIVTASGAFGEMQAAMNAIWHAKPKSGEISRLIRARVVSLGLVATLGFLLIVSLAVSAGLTALGDRLNSARPFGEFIVSALSTIISLALLAALFAAVYKLLPDCSLEWRDVLFGAAVTAVLFVIGKSAIGWYLGSSAIGTTYGAAGSLMILLLWIYYSVQIFLFGAELTKAVNASREETAGGLSNA